MAQIRLIGATLICFIVKSLILMTDVKTLLTSAVTPAILVHRYNLNTDTTRIFTKRASGAAGRYRRAGYQAGATPERVLIHKATHKCFICQRAKYAKTNNTSASCVTKQLAVKSSIHRPVNMTVYYCDRKNVLLHLHKTVSGRTKGCYALMTVRQLNSAA